MLLSKLCFVSSLFSVSVQWSHAFLNSAPHSLRFSPRTTEPLKIDRQLQQLNVAADTKKASTAVPFNTKDEMTIRWKKRTKQLATLGPASSTMEMIEELFLAGADVFRLNFSHGQHEEKKELVDIIRAIEAKHNRMIGILADLQGPKQRCGVFEDDKVELVNGQRFRFDLSDELGDASRVQLPHPEIINTLSKDDTILLDDGKLRMTVVETGEGYVETIVNDGGTLSNRKGVNTPTIRLPISPLTPKDRADLDFIVTLDVDWVALSFVQRAEDMAELRAIVGDKAKIMAKIEKPQAVDDLAEILAESDGIMVARGDLGVEMNPWDVPVVQKKIVEQCRKAGKPVVIATQMLESMITSPTPTRAEASDVATAIFDGADAVMLSAESAAGRFPRESVLMQQKLINGVENDVSYRSNLRATQPKLSTTATDAITGAARQIAHTIDAKCLAVMSHSGSTVIRASKLRPHVPILAITPRKQTGRFLTLSWGVHSAILDVNPAQNLSNEIRRACQAAMEKELVASDADLIVFTAGLPLGSPGVANVLRIVPASGPDTWDPSFDQPHVLDEDDLMETVVNYDDE